MDKLLVFHSPNFLKVWLGIYGMYLFFKIWLKFVKDYKINSIILLTEHSFNFLNNDNQKYYKNTTPIFSFVT